MENNLIIRILGLNIIVKFDAENNIEAIY